MRECEAQGCRKAVSGRGLCRAHYMAERRGTYDRTTGRDDRRLVGATFDEWLAQYVDVADCWLWTGSVTKRGYGECRRGDRTGLAHRVVYIELVADPGELDLDHLCRVRNCVNPDHLEPVTRKVNLDRGTGSFAAGPCKRGHGAEERRRAPSGQTYCQGCRREGRRRRQIDIRKVRRRGK